MAGTLGFMECYSCKSLAGEMTISPGPPIFRGQYWQIEHAYPCGVKGWLVIVLTRHAEALHELTTEEVAELGQLMQKATAALHQALGTSKEYIAAFGEAAHFNHVHVHVIARAPDLPPGLKGPAIFDMLKVSREAAVAPGEIKSFCDELQALFP